VTVTQTEITPAWQSYLDVANDFGPYLQMDPTAVSTNEVALQATVDFACTWVQNYLGRPVAPTDFFRRFSGWSGNNGSYIMLPYYPVLSVASVVEYWGSSGPHTLAEQTPANQGTQDVYQLDPMRGVVIRTFMGLIQRPWFPGSRNIEISWTAGYNPIPADIKLATFEVAAWWWRNTQEAPRWFPKTNEYDAPGNNPLWPAIPNRVTALLQPYVQVGIA